GRRLNPPIGGTPSAFHELTSRFRDQYSSDVRINRGRHLPSEGMLMSVCRLIRIVAVTCAVAALATPAAAKLRLRQPPRGFQMRMESFEVPPSGDVEGCEHMITPNHQPMDVSAFELKATPGTHHFVVWDYLGQDQNPANFWPGIAYATACVGLGPQDG